MSTPCSKPSFDFLPSEKKIQIYAFRHFRLQCSGLSNNLMESVKPYRVWRHLILIGEKNISQKWKWYVFISVKEHGVFIWVTPRIAFELNWCFSNSVSQFTRLCFSPWLRFLSPRMVGTSPSSFVTSCCSSTRENPCPSSRSGKR